MSTKASQVTSPSQSGPVYWLGINSFERRCTGSIDHLSSIGHSLKRVVLLDYPTQGVPEVVDRQLRRDHRDIIENTARATGASFTNTVVDAYASVQFDECLGSIAAELQYGTLIVDISCMTKIHVVALAANLWQSKAPGQVVFLAYTSPRAYGNLNRSSSDIGWNDVLIAPIGNKARMRNESFSRGVIIAGHESERLWAALNEIEPASGLLTLGTIKLRPDITRLSEKINRRVIAHMNVSSETPWSRRVVEVTDLNRMRSLVEDEVEEARKHEAPIILYPFGPKPLIYVASETLLREYSSDSWFVYPVPGGYDVSYSEGVGQTHWFSVNSDPLSAV